MINGEEASATPVGDVEGAERAAERGMNGKVGATCVKRHCA